jgi:hemolysin activation/secretion protein
MGFCSRLRWVSLFAAAGLLMAPSLALSQASRGQSAVPTPQQLNPSVVGRGATAVDNLLMSPEPAPCPLRGSSLAFVLKGVAFKGAKGIDETRLARAFDGKIGQKIPVEEVCEIRDRATMLLFRSGILARVEIPAQRISDGHLELEVIEARIVNVHFHGDPGPAEAKVEAYLEHLRQLAPFDLNVAQRYLLLAREVPGVVVYASIRPSAEGRGAVDLEVTATRKAFEAAVNIQNYGSKSLGPYGGLARGDFSGLTPFGDRSSLVLYSTSDFEEQRVAQILEQFRPGDLGVVVDASASYSTTHPGGDLKPLDLKGDALDLILSASYPIIKRQDRSLSVAGGFEYVDERTNLSGAAYIDDRLRVFFARAHGDANGVILGHVWDAGLDLELRKGVDILNASDRSQTNLSHSGANPDAFVQRIGGHVSFRAGPLVEVYFSGTAQNSDTPALSFEQLAIGNLTIGRGYDPSVIAGDKGAAGSVELRIGPFSPTPGLIIGGYTFFDAAYTKDIDVTGAATTVRSTGAGIRMSYQGRYDLDLLYAKPLNPVSSTVIAPPAERALVSISARY